jgi:hypothetical protein
MRHGPDTLISLACEKQVIKLLFFSDLKLLFLFSTSESISKSFQAMLLQARVDQGGGTRAGAALPAGCPAEGAAAPIRL